MPYTYTLEISAYGYIDSERKTVAFTESLLQTLGKNLGKSIFEFLELKDQEKKEKELRRIERHKRKEDILELSCVQKSQISLITQRKPRSMLEMIKRIKAEPQIMESDSDSYSDDEDEREVLEEKMNKNILKIFKQFDSWVQAPFTIKKANSTSTRLRKRIEQKKSQSSLSRYEIRDSKTANPNSRKIPNLRAESVNQRDILDEISQKSRTRNPSNIKDIANLSYSRGLQAYRNKNDSKLSLSSMKKEQKSVCVVSISKKSKGLILSRDNPVTFSQDISPADSDSSETDKPTSSFKSRYPNQLSSIFGRQVPSFFARAKKSLLI